MKHIFILLFSICFFIQTTSAFTLSRDAEISILTCSPGMELYSLFGHTAIRIQDPAANYDQVFNYGTFDFQTPHFYLKYAQGLLPYQLTKTSFQNFMYAYQMEERSVYAQTLKLDSLQKQHLFDLLLENYRPENRSYLYNFLFDNCTTRSRDILLKSVPGEVEWKLADTGKNFWNLLDEYLQTSPWVQWGIHTILGQRGNRKATTFQYMFLPDYLMYGLDTAFYNNQRLVENIEILYRAPKPQIHNPWYQKPVFVFAVGVILLLFFLFKSKNIVFLNITTLLLFLFTGILGCLIVFLGGFTAHPITAPNWNILWANPLNLIALFFLFRRRLPRFIQIYLTFYTALLIIAIPVWIIAQPAVPFATISLIVLMIYISLKNRNRRNK